MAKTKKLSTIDIVLIVVAAVSMLFVIIGLCVNFITASVDGYSGSDTLANVADVNDLYGGKLYKGLGAVQAFAYITLVLSILSTAALIVFKFVNVKVSNIILVALGALTAVCALVTLITTYTMSDTLFNYDYSAAAGCWLLFIFGLIGGAAAIVSGLNVFGKKAATTEA